MSPESKREGQSTEQPRDLLVLGKGQEEIMQQLMDLRTGEAPESPPKWGQLEDGSRKAGGSHSRVSEGTGPPDEV